MTNRFPLSDELVRLIGFFENRIALNSPIDGRLMLVDDVLKFDLDQIEECHNFIQWLFPLTEKSAFNPEAPVIHAEDYDILIEMDSVTDKVYEGFGMMMEFFNVDMESFKVGTYTLDRFIPNYILGSEQDLLKDKSHHDLRLTRIITSMASFGFTEEAYMLLNFLETFYPERDSIPYWRNAFRLGTAIHSRIIN